MEFFDSHSHYNDESFEEDREELIKETLNQDITRMMCIGYNVEKSLKAIEIAQKNEYIYASCGISPNDIEDNSEENLLKIEEMAKQEKVVAIGEIGLDYHWNKENKEEQKNFFIKQIEIANELNLPIVIHTRDAIMDTITILKSEITCNKKGVFHCCPLNIELVKEALKLGFYISMAGPITFKNSKNAEEIIRYIPKDKMLIETDSPYLAPEPVRGTRNNSSNLKYIVQKIASIKNMSAEEIENITFNNTCNIFKIDN